MFGVSERLVKEVVGRAAASVAEGVKGGVASGVKTVSSGVTSFTGKEEYEFGDLSRAVASRIVRQPSYDRYSLLIFVFLYPYIIRILSPSLSIDIYP